MNEWTNNWMNELWWAVKTSSHYAAAGHCANQAWRTCSCWNVCASLAVQNNLGSREDALLCCRASPEMIWFKPLLILSWEFDNLYVDNLCYIFYLLQRNLYCGELSPFENYHHGTRWIKWHHERLLDPKTLSTVQWAPPTPWMNEWINEFNLPWGKADLKAQSESLFLERFSNVAPVQLTCNPRPYC